MKIRVNDNVLIIAGKDRGKTGNVLRVSDKHNRIVVAKVNMRTRHIKKRQGQQGQKIRFEAPFDASNAIVICPSCSKTTRISFSFLKTGKKQRICKKCGQSVDKPFEKKKTKKR